MRILVAVSLWFVLSVAQAAQYVTIKYRADPVDMSGFDYVDTSGSSFIRGAWYDPSNPYMVIRLN